MNCPHCQKAIADAVIASEAARLASARRVKPTGGARKGAGRPKKTPSLNSLPNPIEDAPADPGNTGHGHAVP